MLQLQPLHESKIHLGDAAAVDSRVDDLLLIQVNQSYTAHALVIRNARLHSTRVCDRLAHLVVFSVHVSLHRRCAIRCWQSNVNTLLNGVLKQHVILGIILVRSRKLKFL